jgi:hypothetical protein
MGEFGGVTAGFVGGAGGAGDVTADKTGAVLTAATSTRIDFSGLASGVCSVLSAVAREEVCA